MEWPMPQGTLFTEDFLTEGIRQAAAWQSLPMEAVTAFRDRLLAVFGEVAHPSQLNEAQTEERIVRPVLAALGWEGCFSVQERAEVRGRANVPDYLLFASPEDFAEADQKPKAAQRYPFAVAVADAKAWSVHLDRRGAGAGDGETPSGQILRYLSRADVQSNGRLRWAILTNGRHLAALFPGRKVAGSRSISRRTSPGYSGCREAKMNSALQRARRRSRRTTLGAITC